MKKNSILFIFILLLCIGLQYETIYYTDGSMSAAEYRLMGVSIFLALFYMLSLIHIYTGDFVIFTSGVSATIIFNQ